MPLYAFMVQDVCRIVDAFNLKDALREACIEKDDEYELIEEEDLERMCFLAHREHNGGTEGTNCSKGGHMYKIIFCMLFILFCLVSATDLQAPEITARDILGFDAYRVAENGSIQDKDGTVKGWICGNTVYDAQWNVRR